MNKRKRILMRLFIQILFFALIALISVNHGLEESGKEIPIVGSASVHALCPFGGVVSIYQNLVSGTFVKKIHESSFILMWIVFALSLAAGPVFCGWVCPFGSFQEWIGKLGHKTIGKRFNRFVPARLDSILRHLRYLVLAWVIIITAATGVLVFEAYDPYYALFNLWSGEVALSGIVILALVILLSLFVERPFCKYACPYGAVLGVFNLFRVFSIRRNAETCISCGACDKACPMNITVSKTEAVRNHQCVTCMKCTSDQACPVSDTVLLSPRTKNFGKPRIGGSALGILVIVVFVSGIGATIAFNLWKTESWKEPGRIVEGPAAGQANPADIKGSYTFAEIEAAFGVPVGDLAKAFGIPPGDAADFKCKDLEAVYGTSSSGSRVGVGSVRLFVARYLSIPYEDIEGFSLPDSAIRLLSELGR